MKEQAMFELIAPNLNIYIPKDISLLSRTSIKDFLCEKRKNDPKTFVVFPHEWEVNKHLITSHVQSYYDDNIKKVSARKCLVKEISTQEVKIFFNKHHIQGSNNLGIKSWGIFLDNQILGALSLGRHSRDTNKVVLDRLCFKDNIRVVGGASKLFTCAKIRR